MTSIVSRVLSPFNTNTTKVYMLIKNSTYNKPTKKIESNRLSPI